MRPSMVWGSSVVEGVSFAELGMRPSWSGTVFSQARRHIIHALNLTADAGMRPSWSVPLFRRRDASPFTLSFSQDSLNDTISSHQSLFTFTPSH